MLWTHRLERYRVGEGMNESRVMREKYHIRAETCTHTGDQETSCAVPPSETPLFHSSTHHTVPHPHYSCNQSTFNKLPLIENNTVPCSPLTLAGLRSTEELCKGVLLSILRPSCCPTAARCLLLGSCWLLLYTPTTSLLLT